MTEYKLIALDMDGTLLMSDKSVHPDTVRDIAYAAGKGAHIVYCSGRALVELRPYVDLLPDIRFAVSTSGSEVYDFQEEKYVFRRSISLELAREVVTLVGETTGMLQFLTDGVSIIRADMIDHLDDYHMGVFEDLYRQVATTVPSMMEEADRHESISKINFYFRTKTDWEEAYEKVKDLPLTFALPEECTLEMTAKGVSKALGLQMLAEKLGISMEETIGIGDGDNDRAVLEAVGFPVAMGNASPDIRRLCCLVTDDNDHNGVGKAIREILGPS